MAKGIGGHHTGEKKDNSTWITPKYIIDALGEFDTDPATPEEGMPWPTATVMYKPSEDGLLKPWRGRIWLNPPYASTEITKWMKRMSLYNNGIALVFARTETKFFQKYVFQKATSILFISGRLTFHHSNGEKAKGTGGAPSVLIAYGEENSRVLEKCGIPGMFLKLK